MIYLNIVDNIQKVEPEVALTSQKETGSSSKYDGNVFFMHDDHRFTITQIL